MERDEQTADGLVDLGAISAETKGPPGELNDITGQMTVDIGLSDN